MKNKVCFIIPYFGKLPNYFPLFLKSCSYNPGYNWLLFTDDETKYDYPGNVHRVVMAFKELQTLVKSKYDFPVCFENAYKLCDFKPAYGHIFSDYLIDYTHWGHCDIDVIMGNLNDFISDELLDSYDKLFSIGHFIIYKNTSHVNLCYMSTYNNKVVYKDVFQTPKIMVFDEEGRTKYNVNNIFKENGFKVLDEDWSLNFSIFYTAFHRTFYVGMEKSPDGFVLERTCDHIVVWDNGCLYRYSLNRTDKEIIKEEYMYLHLQERHMSFDISICELNTIKIVPDKFLPLEVDEITADNYDRIIIKYLSFHKFHRFIKENRRRLKKIAKILKFEGI